MASKKRIKRQRQRRKRNEKDAATAVAGNEADRHQFVDKDAGNDDRIWRAEKNSQRKMEDSKTSDSTSRMESVSSWTTTWMEKTVGSLRFPSMDSFFQVINPRTSSKSATIVLVLVLSLVIGNFDYLAQTTRLGLSSISASVALLYTAISTSLVLPCLVGYMIYNSSRTNDKSTTNTSVHAHSKSIDDEFVVIRPLGLKSTAMISFDKTNETSFDSDGTGSPPPKAQLASSKESRTKLAEWLPFGLRYTSDLNLVFSTNVHGRSLQTLYHIIDATSSTHTILLLEAFPSSGSNRIVIGMYASQRWHSSPKIYGDGRCFLFRLSEDPRKASECWKWTPSVLPTHNLSSSTSQMVRNHHDTSNDNTLSLWETFQRSNQNSLSLGVSACGVGAGLKLNHDMTVGESHRAVGFENDPLCSTNEETAQSSVFDVGLVEVYQLVREIDGRAIQS